MLRGEHDWVGFKRGQEWRRDLQAASIDSSLEGKKELRDEWHLEGK